MNTYITIDGGTTNTRLHLVRNETVLSTVKLPFGARANMDGTAHYKEAIRDAYATKNNEFEITPEIEELKKKYAD